KNKGFIFIMALIAAVQVLMVYFGGTLFRTVPITYRELLFVLGLSLTVFIVDFFRRIFIKLK
ncbi:MAG: cation transporting ATPase C-terminal domain-containing protein, partial [Clostridia bacterium]|nr:cation transporting ATPase C-terminal domain-containing protein [Clostridia bacterium]